jgi:acetoin utilization deacetylase AcuC-like enzyme
MFRIRRIYDDVLPINGAAIADVQQILVDHFPGAPRDEIDNLPKKLRDPSHAGFRTVLYVAENARGRVTGFALVMHDPKLKLSYLDFIATVKGVVGRGVGAALYERVREDARWLGAQGLFFECLPDTPAGCRDPAIRKQNIARMRFYERYGARPIMNTDYESPFDSANAENLPYLMFDGLDRGEPLRRDFAARVARRILEAKYSRLCSPQYIRQVVSSFHDDPVRLRPYRYSKLPADNAPASERLLERIAVSINDKHDIHHIRERGYVESPVRIKAILDELTPSGLLEILPAREYSRRHIHAVHDRDFVTYLQRACQDAPPNKSVYPYVFPIRNATRPPKFLSVRAGYYCIDTFTPINRNAFPAAKRAVDCAMTAADEILKGRRLAYALVRPPGHHAERRSFGGFCYFNNAAVAAHYLSQFGKIAILDIDYHHGNGQQDIFYSRSDVLTVSIHGAPNFAYPYFSGFADERGIGAGVGFNVNLPLPEIQDGAQFRRSLTRVLQIISDFRPAYLIVALGLDTAKGDPTGTWLLSAKDFKVNGQMIAELALPTLVVQEGGYRIRTLGANARMFFQGLAKG